MFSLNLNEQWLFTTARFAHSTEKVQNSLHVFTALQYCTTYTLEQQYSTIQVLQSESLPTGRLKETTYDAHHPCTKHFFCLLALHIALHCLLVCCTVHRMMIDDAYLFQTTHAQWEVGSKEKVVDVERKEFKIICRNARMLLCNAK